MRAFSREPGARDRSQSPLPSTPPAALMVPAAAPDHAPVPTVLLIVSFLASYTQEHAPILLTAVRYISAPCERDHRAAARSPLSLAPHPLSLHHGSSCRHRHRRRRQSSRGSVGLPPPRPPACLSLRQGRSPSQAPSLQALPRRQDGLVPRSSAAEAHLAPLPAARSEGVHLGCGRQRAQLASAWRAAAREALRRSPPAGRDSVSESAELLQARMGAALQPDVGSAESAPRVEGQQSRESEGANAAAGWRELSRSRICITMCVVLNPRKSALEPEKCPAGSAQREAGTGFGLR